MLEQTASRAHDRAVRAVADAGAELAHLGGAAEAEARIAELERGLPSTVELAGSEPPSVALRLERAGVEVVRTA
jgi:hypothetical protein